MAARPTFKGSRRRLQVCNIAATIRIGARERLALLFDDSKFEAR